MGGMLLVSRLTNLVELTSKITLSARCLQGETNGLISPNIESKMHGIQGAARGHKYQQSGPSGSGSTLGLGVVDAVLAGF